MLKLLWLDHNGVPTKDKPPRIRKPRIGPMIAEPLFVLVEKPIYYKPKYFPYSKFPSKAIRRNPHKLDYYEQVWLVTESQPLHLLKDIEKRSSDFNLDHIIPISYGYKHNIAASVIGDISNLRIISREENFKKNKLYSPTIASNLYP